MDDNYQTYLNRVARTTLPETYQTQVQHVQESSKFCLTPNGERKAAAFPGYTLITPPSGEESQNSSFYAQIQLYQEELLKLAVDHDLSDLIVALPTSSFHMTIADLIWDSAYHHACDRNPHFESDLQSCCGKIFQQYHQNPNFPPGENRWNILGIMIMPRAIGISLVPKNQASYEQIIQLRRKIYQNPQLISLGIEQQYHYTAHITLAYFGQPKPDWKRDRFADTMTEFNQKWLTDTPDFTINRVELRKFDDMTRYYRQPNWAAIDF
ncbi:DUF1868 domain-containing protein [Calothrix sp. PCC 6303]|uniref:DUF1868 domain-containing protein n=1 Tax=Calothrix sp. PCC 6303 TaxID=1170562 RepID=UPI0002A01407|nr:DUF1868 domain-containing protein [Calothrix sp. PCC 6303]AFZ04046.1 hypothetical protein Cal6303_5158 [Calothrix sp. PCC 6303]